MPLSEANGSGHHLPGAIARAVNCHVTAGLMLRTKLLRCRSARSCVGVGPTRAKRRSASENYRGRGSASPGSNPVASSFFRNEPSGEHVEGLSYLRDESYAVECAARTHDFEDSTLCVVVGGKPLLAKRLRAPRLPFPKEASLAFPPFSAGRSRAMQMEALLGRIA